MTDRLLPFITSALLSRLMRFLSDSNVEGCGPSIADAIESTLTSDRPTSFNLLESLVCIHTYVHNIPTTALNEISLDRFSVGKCLAATFFAYNPAEGGIRYLLASLCSSFSV